MLLIVTTAVGLMSLETAKIQDLQDLVILMIVETEQVEIKILLVVGDVHVHQQAEVDPHIQHMDAL